MAVKIVTSGSCVTAYIEGEIDHHNAPALRESIDSAIEKSRPKTLKLDFGGVSFMDSSGVGLVMGRYKNAARYGGEVEVLNLSRSAERIMKLSALENFVRFKKSAEKGCQ